MHFIDGLLVGWATIIFIGPVFFLLLSSTLQSGFWAGLMVALGIIISDIVYAIICQYGIASVVVSSKLNSWLAIAGCALLMGMGIKYLLAKPMAIETTTALYPTNYSTNLIKGFLINFINPFVFMVWMGIVNYVNVRSPQSPFVFLLGCLVGIFSTDFLKVVLAKHIKQFITTKLLFWLYKIIGIALIVFAIRMGFVYLF